MLLRSSSTIVENAAFSQAKKRHLLVKLFSADWISSQYLMHNSQTDFMQPSPAGKSMGAPPPNFLLFTVPYWQNRDSNYILQVRWHLIKNNCIPKNHSYISQSSGFGNPHHSKRKINTSKSTISDYLGALWALPFVEDLPLCFGKTHHFHVSRNVTQCAHLQEPEWAHCVTFFLT